MSDLKPLYIVLCENGQVYDDCMRMGVYSNDFHAEEKVEILNKKGSPWCRCKKHTMVTYVPVPEEYDWYICPMCPDKKSIPIRAKGVNVLCDCGMMMFGVPKSDSRVKI